MHRLRASLLLTCLAVLVLPSLSIGAPGRALVPAPESLPLVWRVSDADLSFPQHLPPVGDGMLVLEDDRALVGIQLASGRRTWTARDVLPPGRDFYVSVAGGKVVVSTQGKLTAYAVDRGTVLWTRSLPCSYTSGLRTEGDIGIGLCTKGSWNQPPSGPSPALSGISLEDGRSLWEVSSRTGVDDYGTDGRAVALTDHAVGTGPSPGQIRALDARSGKPLWTVELRDVSGSLVFSDQTVVLVAPTVTAFSLERGERRWSFPQEKPMSHAMGNLGFLRRPTVFNGELLLPRRDGFVRVSLANGKLAGVIPRPGKYQRANDRELHVILAGGEHLVVVFGGDVMGVGGDLFLWDGRVWHPFKSPGGAAELHEIIRDRLLCRFDDSVAAYSLVLPDQRVAPLKGGPDKGVEEAPSSAGKR